MAMGRLIYCSQFARVHDPGGMGSASSHAGWREADEFVFQRGAAFAFTVDALTREDDE